MNSRPRSSGAMPTPVSSTSSRNARVALGHDAHGDAAAFGRELERVRQVVVGDLLEPRRIEQTLPDARIDLDVDV